MLYLNNMKLSITNNQAMKIKITMMKMMMKILEEINLKNKIKMMINQLFILNMKMILTLIIKIVLRLTNLMLENNIVVKNSLDKKIY